MDANNPTEVARNMVAVRGLEQTLERCANYISGHTRSEKPADFWQAVRTAALAEAIR